jgi:hypothetical protein
MEAFSQPRGEVSYDEHQNVCFACARVKKTTRFVMNTLVVCFDGVWIQKPTLVTNVKMLFAFHLVPDQKTRLGEILGSICTAWLSIVKACYTVWLSTNRTSCGSLSNTGPELEFDDLLRVKQQTWEAVVTAGACTGTD